MTPEELIDAVGRLAAANGWVLVHIERNPSGVGVVFAANESPYGSESSQARAKSRVAVLTDAATRLIVGQAEEQRQISGNS